MRIGNANVHETLTRPPAGRSTWHQGKYTYALVRRKCSYFVLCLLGMIALLNLAHVPVHPPPAASADRCRRMAKAKPGSNGTPQVFRLFGYAGTGKTTLARHIADEADGEVKFAAFTGKAASVMRGKGCRGASTIHSLIYRARESGEEIPSFDLVGRGAGLEGRADHHRRVLDGRRRARPRSALLRRAGAGARRSRAAAADPGRRLLHRGRARRDAHRGAPAGAGRSDRAAVDGRPRRRIHRAGPLR